VDLTRLSEDEFGWETEVPFAIGHVRAADVGRFFASTFAAAEGRTLQQVQSDYGTHLPRTTAIAGRLFRVDSIRSIPLADRSWTSVYAVTMTPNGVESQYPELAKYLRRYVNSARMRLALTDSSGARYLDISIQNAQMIVRTRTAAGQMLALYGPARGMPDSMTLMLDMTVKVRGFTVGVRNYRGDFRIVSDDNERAWELVSRREPDWVLPLITERLIRTPLRRPFQGPGAYFRIGVRDTAGAQSILNRAVRLEVQESAVLRFIGRLGAIAVSDYAGKVEEEEMAYLKELFDAIMIDAQGLP
jgi:hypothetical protein